MGASLVYSDNGDSQDTVSKKQLKGQRYHGRGELIPGMSEFCSINILKADIQEGLKQTFIVQQRIPFVLFFHAIKAEKSPEPHEEIETVPACNSEGWRPPS